MKNSAQLTAAFLKRVLIREPRLLLSGSDCLMKKEAEHWRIHPGKFSGSRSQQSEN
ncbi:MULTISPECIES: hypothetical protein [unclassified Sporolactobacillus]|uniref:hypothetical protein n=1 Tax=unclassified Sporolactobacillus TaxID=2628533 RepID=UPI002368E0DC|nr:hypothetical protein [Sporolactobacillus sp. CQH2019]MDD9147728.1 hypothetical protein [Sporolactobacillus sp. CQH2019]